MYYWDIRIKIFKILSTKRSYQLCIKDKWLSECLWLNMCIYIHNYMVLGFLSTRHRGSTGPLLTPRCTAPSELCNPLRTCFVHNVYHNVDMFGIREFRQQWIFILFFYWGKNIARESIDGEFWTLVEFYYFFWDVSRIFLFLPVKI